MRNGMHLELDHIQGDTHLAKSVPRMEDGLPHRLLTAFEVAELVGCHE